MKIKEYIVYEDENIVAVNKPSGLLTIADREGNIALKNLLTQQYDNILTVHRLDRDTSGLLVFARNEETHRQLSMMFEGREVQKFYQGLVLGKPAQTAGTIETGIMEHPVKKGTMVVHAKGKTSITDYEVLESFRFFSWMQFQIHTGRTHQIRVHMKHLGHPIVCDDMYGDGKPVLLSSIKNKFKLSKDAEEERPILARMALHSYRLQFKLGGKDFKLEAEPPKDLRACLQQLRKWGPS